ncbi:MAG: hypothetical protein AB1414_03350 [bacterium]
MLKNQIPISVKEILISLYVALSFILITGVIYLFPTKTHPNPFDTFQDCLLLMSVGVFIIILATVLLNLLRPDRLRILGISLLYLMYLTVAFASWAYLKHDAYSNFVWHGILGIALLLTIDLDKTFNQENIEKVEKFLSITINIGMAIYGIWAILVGYIILKGETYDKLGNIIYTTYTGLGLFWLYMEMITRKTELPLPEKYVLNILLPISQQKIDERSSLFFEKLFINPSEIQYYVITSNKNTQWKELDLRTELRKKHTNYIAYCNSRGEKASSSEQSVDEEFLRKINFPETLGEDNSLEVIRSLLASALRVTVNQIRKEAKSKKINNLIPTQTIRGQGEGYSFHADIHFLPKNPH